mgnify:CR=1 FL=1
MMTLILESIGLKILNLNPLTLTGISVSIVQCLIKIYNLGKTDFDDSGTNDERQQ